MRGSAIRRIGYERWLRNLAVGLGNAPSSPEVIAALRSRVDHRSAARQGARAMALSSMSGWRPDTLLAGFDLFRGPSPAPPSPPPPDPAHPSPPRIPPRPAQRPPLPGPLRPPPPTRPLPALQLQFRTVNELRRPSAVAGRGGYYGGSGSFATLVAPAADQCSIRALRRKQK